jgi:putative peptidoglycan lipid II flippase
MATLLSMGISVVIFPRMALKVTEMDVPGLRNTISLSLRLMWLVVAPAMSIGIAMALPIVTVLLQRGQFNHEDAQAVASLMRVYLFALIGMSLGTVTGRSLYALRDTRIIARLGIIQSLVYVVYAFFLVSRLGVVGAAIAYVLYFNLSLLWQVFLIRHKTGGAGGYSVVHSFVKTSIAAIVAGITAYISIPLAAFHWLQLVLGSAVGISIYVIMLTMLRSGEVAWLFAALRGMFAVSNQILNQE